MPNSRSLCKTAHTQRATPLHPNRNPNRSRSVAGSTGLPTEGVIFFSGRSGRLRRNVRLPLHRRHRQGRSFRRTHPAGRSQPAGELQLVGLACTVNHKQRDILVHRSGIERAPSSGILYQAHRCAPPVQACQLFFPSTVDDGESVSCSAVDVWFIMQNDIQQRAVDFQVAVVVNQA
jgi:hypothetical protein